VTVSAVSAKYKLYQTEKHP